MTADVPPPALRWRCRRGMRELDVLLECWLVDCWPLASDPLRQEFENLLEAEDDQIWDWVTDRANPPESVQSVVAAVRERTPSPHG